MDVRQGMDVVSSDGKVVGRTGAAEQDRLSVEPVGGGIAGTRHVPLDWVTRVDEHVHLRHSADMIHAGWRGGAVPPHRTEGRGKLPWIIGLVLLLIAVFLLFWALFYAADTTHDSGRALPTATSQS